MKDFPFNLLIVDENPEKISFLKEAFKKGEVSTHWARSYQEALAFNGLDDIGLIVIDIQGPGDHGFKIATQFQENPLTEKKPILFLIPIRQESKNLFKESGLHLIDYLQKPLEIEVLMSKIRLFAQFNGIQQELVREVERRRTLEEQMLRLAQHDALTGLPNRSQFLDYLSGSIARAKRRGGQMAVLFLDLDHFKNINDSLGHSAGDALLERVANRLTDSVREGDLVSRFAADEFGVILEDIESLGEVTLIANGIIDNLAHAYIVANQKIFVSASMGIAIFPDSGPDIELLMNSVDTALSYAKSQGRNNYQFFVKEMNLDSKHRMRIALELRHALERQELTVYYQPQIEIKTGKVVGMEALLRWTHHELGMVSPTQFIPIAEESGLIVAIGEWVLSAACLQRHRGAHDAMFPVSISVNVSIRQLQLTNFIHILQETLKRTGLAPELLELELTESTVMEDPEAAILILNEIHALGIRIAVDDFGTGYSSLNYLRRLPIDTLKIDQSFIRDIGSDGNDEAIVKAIISMAHSLGLDVVAEGVESKIQFDFLKAHGCDIIQGYYFSQPLPYDAILIWLKEYEPSSGN